MKRVQATLFVAAGLVAQLSHVHGASTHRFVVHNNAPYPIIDYQFRASANSPWVEATLGSDIAPGDTRIVPLPPSLPCTVDVQVTLANGARKILPGLNSCDSKGKFSANIPPPPPLAPEAGGAGSPQ